MKHIGTAYYPEAWPEERWIIDAETMAEAGFNLARLGEFAWAKLEPAQDRFELDWLKRVVTVLGDRGIDVILSTPTAAPPAWLLTNFPETRLRDGNGVPAPLGTRRHYCPSSETFRERARRIVNVLADAFADNPSVIGWQIDNEVAIGETECLCDGCVEGFRRWLQNKYADLDTLNQAWGTIFWSARIDDWNQIAPPLPRISWQLDWHEYQTRLYARLIEEQVGILKSVNPQWRITTNSWLGLVPNLNQIELFKSLDVVGYDCYVNYHGGLDVYRATWDLYRNMISKPRPFWIMETGAWNCVTTGDENFQALRAWAYEFFARGAEAMVYFRWRQSVMGEEEHPAILSWSGKPTTQYQIIKSFAKELRNLTNQWPDLPLSRDHVAILFHPTVAAIAHCRKNSGDKDAIVTANATLNDMWVTPDILPVTDGLDLSGYKLVVAPELERVDDALAAKLTTFVKQGGTLFAQGRLGVIDDNGKYLPSPAPNGLTELFGIEINERWDIADTPRYGPTQYDPVQEASDARFVNADCGGAPARCFRYMEKLELKKNATVTGRFHSGVLKGHPLIVQNKFGSGQTIYQAAPIDAAGNKRIMLNALRLAGLNPPNETDPDVGVVKRGPLRFYVNHSQSAKTLKAIRVGDVVIGEASGDKITLPPFGVCVIDEHESQ